jgi:hypothetical protein
MQYLLCTIGFAGKTAQEFFALLEEAGVERLIDIRQNRGGQLSGYAKHPDLAYFLHKIAGIDYVHEPLLATVTAMEGGGGGGGTAELAPPPPQPCVHAPVVRSAAKTVRVLPNFFFPICVRGRTPSAMQAKGQRKTHLISRWCWTWGLRHYSCNRL